MVSGPRRIVRTRQGGYNLVALMVLIAVLNIGVAASLPHWSKLAQRDKEEELIFRGLQYAEAIRIFQKRTGRFPTRLEELVEVEPRSIRQLWTDPLNDEPEWGLILAATGNPNPAAGRQLGGGLGDRNSGRDDAEDTGDGDEAAETRRRLRSRRGDAASTSPRQRIPDPRERGSFLPRRGQQVSVAPIIGVHSLVDGKALKTFQGSSNYKEWRFSADLIPAMAGPSGADVMPRLHANWIGRPFPNGIEPKRGTSPTDVFDTDDRRPVDRDADGLRRGRRRGPRRSQG